MRNYLTVHIINALPMHNLNRDANGQPKSQFDGGIQRARLSSQSLKRPARLNYLAETYPDAQGGPAGSIRTKDGAKYAQDAAVTYAEKNNLPYDTVQGLASIKKVISSTASKSEDSENVLYLAFSELNALGIATVDAQQSESESTLDDFILDATSASLDIAAFGRMFAAQPQISTHAAIAVSNAVTTHQMALTADYFTAVEEGNQDHNGAAHLGLAYYTSGVYYRTFTIDIAQIRRSWKNIDADGAPADLARILKSLILSLPQGKMNATNAHTLPALVFAEEQAHRYAYSFDAPVAANDGYLKPTIAALAESHRAAVSFYPDVVGEAVVLGDTKGEDFGTAAQATNVNDLIAFIVNKVYADR